ncbi:MAG: UvrD-helicase domain-containing protein [Bacteroidales bacterium]|nr:UvrD-helicase domain-containing protein [Bacteroidales bacterium]
MDTNQPFLPTEEQSIVINDLSHNILLNATAGTGKTQTLTQRLTNIIQSGAAKPEQVLNITFTNQACKEMRKRVTNEFKEKKIEYDGLTIKTFHSWCLSILTETAERTGIASVAFTVIDEDDAKEIRKEILQNLNIHVNDRQFESIIERMKHQRMQDNRFSGDENDDLCITLQKVIKENEKGTDWETLVKEYELYLRKTNSLDFTDLVMRASQLFNDKEVVEFYRTRYKYINIDEAQDTSIYEFSIIEKLFDGNKILLSGDLFQSIYEWRYANPEKVFRHFIETYNPITCTLTTNFRSSRELVRLAFNYLKNAFPQQYKLVVKENNYHAQGENGQFIIKHPDSLKTEAQYLKEQIDNIMEHSKEERIAILVRSNDTAKILSAILHEYDSPLYQFHLVDDFKFFRRQEIKDIMAFLKIIENPANAYALKRILLNFGKGIGKETINDLLQIQQKNIGFKFTDFLISEDGDAYGPLINAYEKGQPIVVFDTETTGLNVYRDEVIQIAAIKLQKGKVVDVFNKFLKTEKDMGESEKVHHISKEKLEREGKDRTVVLKQFANFINNTIAVGHNVRFDQQILLSEYERNGIESPDLSIYYDTLDLAQRFYPQLENHQLGTLCKHFNFTQEQAHDALSDVKDTVKLLNHLVPKIMDTQKQRLEELSKISTKVSDFAVELLNFKKQAKNLPPHKLVALTKTLFNICKNDPRKAENIEILECMLQTYKEAEESNSEALRNAIAMTLLSNGELEDLYIKRDNKRVIPIITVHQVKGLEFDTVFIAQATSDSFPCYNPSTQTAEDTREERQLFYVAITRAKKRLIITCPQQKTIWSPKWQKEFTFPTVSSPYIEYLIKP